MTAPTADMLVYQGTGHFFHPPANTKQRITWCDKLPAPIPVDDLTPMPDKPTPGQPIIVKCLDCMIALGTELAGYHGANVYRAPDPEGLSSADA